MTTTRYIDCTSELKYSLVVCQGLVSVVIVQNREDAQCLLLSTFTSCLYSIQNEVLYCSFGIL